MRQVLVVFLLIAGSVAAQPGGSSYLTPAEEPDMTRVLPGPPTPGSPEYTADRAIFKATRALKGSTRWQLAINDAKLSIAALLADFGCALGMELTPQNAPHTAALLSGVLRASGGMIGPPKQKFERKRPFLIDPVSDDEVCTVKLTDFDYPSGHTTIGWAIGLVLADIEPGRATAVLTRARAFGQSRVVCGMHNATAVEAGFMAGSAVAAALQQSTTFRADADAAKAELAALRQGAKFLPDRAACEAEDQALAVSPY